MEEAIRKAEQAFDAAYYKLGKVNGKAGNGTEVTYALAYQRLVSLGARAQIKGKYRP